MKHITYILLLVFMIQGCTRAKVEHTSDNSPISLTTAQESFVAGQVIVLKFEAAKSKGPLLVITNALGTSIIEPVLNEGGIEFHIPYQFTQKAGLCKWQLVRNGKIELSGKLHIIPDTVDGRNIETYLGPRSITAGDRDFTMLVVAPTDRYDNPLVDETPVTVKQQFEGRIAEENIKINNLMAWTNIGAPQKSGRILATASVDNSYSKELTTIVYPANATDFTIDYQREHSYADGNQSISFSTSNITDQYGNKVSDGTLVTFMVENGAGALLQTTGTTIDGVAKAKLLHPSQKDTWSITAFITGAAKSSSIAVDFESAVTDYLVSYDNDKRSITVGPIKSFMGQQIPDGLDIQTSIYNTQNALLETKHTTSKHGYGEFFLSPDYFLKGKYRIEVETAGINQSQTLEIQ